MYHSITFGEKNTWDDWHLIPSSRPVFSPPEPKIRQLEIPGRSGSLDITESFGQVVYADRTGSFEFYVDHESDGYPWNSWADCYHSIMTYLHGKKMKAVLEDDPMYYYEGRFKVNEWKSNANFSTIVIDYNVSPFKFLKKIAGDDWLWDPFYFGPVKTPETEHYRTGDIIPSLKNMNLDSAPRRTIIVKLTGSDYRAIPEITCSGANVSLYFDDAETPIYLSKGINRPRGVILTSGEHTLQFFGNGTISIEYRGGSL